MLHGVVAGRGLGSIGREADVGAIVQSASRVTDSDDLEGPHGALGDIAVVGQADIVQAEQALTCGVHELVVRKGDVEVSRVLPKTEVQEDVGPGVVKVKLDGSSFQRPLGDISRSEIGTGTYEHISNENFVRVRGGASYKGMSIGTEESLQEH